MPSSSHQKDTRPLSTGIALVRTHHLVSARPTHYQLSQSNQIRCSLKWMEIVKIWHIWLKNASQITISLPHSQINLWRLKIKSLENEWNMCNKWLKSNNFPIVFVEVLVNRAIFRSFNISLTTFCRN